MIAVAAILLLLITINALYVAAEFAAVSVSPSRVQALAEDGSRPARRLMPYLRDVHALDRYIAACQLGITASSLILGAYGQATLSELLVPVFATLGGMQEVAAESTAAVVVLIGLTIVQMVLGELVPKSLALQFPTTAALWTVRPMQWSLRLMAWFIVVLNGSGTAILRLIGFEPSGHRHIHSPSEIEYLLAESREGGLLAPHQHRRLRRALRLGTKRLDEFLVPRVRIAALDIDAPAAEALATILDSPYTRLPVYRSTIDDIVGLIHTKDVARHIAEHGADIEIAGLVRPLLVVPGSMRADQLLVRMREDRRQMAVVLDEFGGTMGLVTIENVLEQVVGEIVDERRPPATAPQFLPDGRIRVAGDMRIDELETVLGIALPEGDVHTVSGRVMESLGRVPERGDRVEIDGIAFEVEAVHGNAVARVLLEAPDRRHGDRPEDA
jgi:CBS domain containing-hemolysin-like protein